MRNILDIYKEYKIMPNLQMHMLRVAAVASMICDNFDESLPKADIVTACILHDMGNIIKSNFEFLSELTEPQGREYWEKVKSEYIEKYGSDEHKATTSIMKELKIPEKIIAMANEDRFSLLCEHLQKGDTSINIMQYSDYRCSPHGIVSFEERMDESWERYKHKDTDGGERRRQLVECGLQIEKQIFEHCKIRPEDITDESVAPIISELKNFVIK